MNAPEGFDFGNSSVAQAYDDVLVPFLFEPWAAALATDPQWQWQGKTVVDLAAGTGIVAASLLPVIGPQGELIAADINGEMLQLARQRCAGSDTPVRFVETPAHPLELPDASADIIVCQQGFQFFPERDTAAREMARVLRPGGRVVVSAWHPLRDIPAFQVIFEALQEIGENDIAELIRRPFDFMPQDELAQHFQAAGFDEVVVRSASKPLRIAGGIPRAVEAAFATPIAPHLMELSEQQRQVFRDTLARRYETLRQGDDGFGESKTSILTARRPA